MESEAIFHLFLCDVSPIRLHLQHTSKKPELEFKNGKRQNLWKRPQSLSFI